MTSSEIEKALKEGRMNEKLNALRHLIVNIIHDD